MFSLQKLLGKDEQFFQLLEASAEEACDCVQALKRVLADRSNTIGLEDFMASRRKGKEIKLQISELLCSTFVSSMEREDIESIAAALSKVPKTTEKLAERFILTGAQAHDVDLSPQVSMLEQATETVWEMVKSLRRKTGLAKVAELNGHLHQIEGDADKLMLKLLKDLYGGAHQPLKALVLKDLYELTEKIIDRTRDAGNVLYHLVLRYS